MAGLLSKFKEFIGVDSYEDEELDSYEYEEEEDMDTEDSYSREEAKKSFFDSYEPTEQETVSPKTKRGMGRKEKIVNFSGNNNGLKVVLSNPTEFDNCPNICAHLKSNMTVVLNLEYVQNATERRRVFDFVSGCCFALDCNIQKVSELIYVVAPHTVDLLAEVDLDKDDSIEEEYDYRQAMSF